MKKPKQIKRPMDISNGTRMNWLMKKTGYKKSRETVPLKPIPPPGQSPARGRAQRIPPPVTHSMKVVGRCGNRWTLWWKAIMNMYSIYIHSLFSGLRAPHLKLPYSHSSRPRQYPNSAAHLLKCHCFPLQLFLESKVIRATDFFYDIYADPNPNLCLESALKLLHDYRTYLYFFIIKNLGFFTGTV